MARPRHPSAPPGPRTPRVSTTQRTANATTDVQLSLHRAVHPSTTFEPRATWGRGLVGLTYLMLVLGCAFLNVALVLWPLTLWRRCCHVSIRSIRPVFCFLEDHFFTMASGLLELVGGVEIVVTGDELLPVVSHHHNHVLVVCNHRSEVDGMFVWNLALRLGVHDRIRIMMKSGIRYVPGVGWAMLLLEYPYINRTWTTDQARLAQVIASYKEVDMGTWLAMFPEGTALYDRTLAQSHDFAVQRGEPTWDFVLQPRVKGFQLCMEKLEPEYVVDLTIAYPELMDGVRPSPRRFAQGQYPKEVHMHVRRYHRSTLAKHKDHMDRWLKDRFAEKEELLRHFYETGTFDGKPCVHQKLPTWSSVVPGIAFNLGLCCLALYLWIKYPVVTGTWFTLSTMLSVVQARSFGN